MFTGPDVSSGTGTVTGLVRTRFVWSHGGRTVHLCGDFTRWQDPLEMLPVEGHEGVFATIIDLPPGYVQYKFIVDDEWRHDDDQALMPDPLGHLNNWKYVKESDSVAEETGIVVSHALLPEPIQQLAHQIPHQSAHQIPHHQLPPGLLMDIDVQQGHGFTGFEFSSNDAKISRQQISDFLNKHTAYELLPESSKVVALDVSLPVKQAFHALYEQGIPAAPLWDSARQQFVGMLSASDFITILRQLGSNGALLSEEELDTHTIAAWKDEKALQGTESGTRRPLIYAGPDETLRNVVDKLIQHGVAAIPILSINPAEGNVPRLLHLASLSGVLKSLMRNFRHSGLPVLSLPIVVLPLGTWAAGTGKGGGRPLAILKANASLTSALTLLLEAGVSSLPVVDDNEALVDVYARNDITALAKDRAYTRLQLDEITVTQALMYRQDVSGGGSAGSRCHMCLRADTLRQVMERLATPGVRRLICVEAGSRKVEGIISLRDVFTFLLCVDHALGLRSS